MCTLHLAGSSAAGKQVFSTKKTAPTIAFGSSTRDQTKKMFISVDHEKSNYGEGSPGQQHGARLNAVLCFSQVQLLQKGESGRLLG